MEPGTSRERFEKLIALSGVPLASLTPQAGLELMLCFYGHDPTNGYLTCSWGVVTRYGEEEFGFQISRLFHAPSDAPSAMPSELALVFKIGPQATAGDFPGWMKWCADLEHLETFRSTVEGSPPFRVWGRSPAAEVVLVDEDVESWAYALFDCWGVRDPSRPVVSMTEEEWLRSDDASLMLRWFRQEWSGEEADLDRLLYRYCLACCRRIWRLLPQEESRSGVEVAERFLNGLATRDELRRAEWLAEAAAFTFDQDSDPEAIARWCDQVSRIPPEELAAMLSAPRPGDGLSPRRLLEHAAFFADSAMCYPSIQPKESIEKYRLLLPTPLLREIVGNPFRSSPGRQPA